MADRDRAAVHVDLLVVEPELARHVADRNDLVVKAAGFGRSRPPLMGYEREGVLVLARDTPALGDVLTGLTHRLGREHLRELRIRETPAERRVVERAVAARQCLF